MRVELAYAQARVLARHGERLSAASWRLLETSRGLAQYLHAVRGTALAPWVQHFSTNTTPHVIERSLRRDWRVEVTNVAHWVPEPWHAAVTWTAVLPDMPAVTHLLRGDFVYPWMKEDPVFSTVGLDDAALRQQAISHTGLAPLLAEGIVGPDLLMAWVGHWQRLWPEDDRAVSALFELTNLVRRYREKLADSDVSPAGARDTRSGLQQNVVRLMRRNFAQPVCVFCHLLLTALDMHRLRDGLIRRALLTETGPGA